MNRRFGIDTSVLVRLATGDPEVDYLKNVAALTDLVELEQAEILDADGELRVVKGGG